MSAQCTVSMYHYVRDTSLTPFPAIHALSLKDFSLQLDWLQANTRILTYEEFAESMYGKTSSEPTTLLTFDDGLIDHYAHVFPELSKRGISGVFFLPSSMLDDPPRLLPVHAIHHILAKIGSEAFIRSVTELLEQKGFALPSAETERQGLYRYDGAGEAKIKRMLNYDVPFDLADAIVDQLFTENIGDSQAFARALYITNDMIREMSKGGMTFGGHTKNHRVLSRLTPDEQFQELTGTPDRIRALTGQKRVPFGIPYGHPSTYTPDTLRILQECGYDSAFSTVRGKVDFATVHAFELPRLDTKDLPPFVEAFHA